MSEFGAFQAFYDHSSGCRSCRPSSRVVCDEGRQLHDAWREAAVQDLAAQKRELQTQERKSREPTQPTLPRRAVPATLGGRPRRQVRR